MILGVGIDLSDPRRIRRAAERWGERFLERVFGEEERRYCLSLGNPWPSLAARFAAKEALVKALGSGLREGMSWREIEVVRGGDGRPDLRLHGRAAAVLRARGALRVHLSLSHEGDRAAALVVLEGDPA